MSEPAMDTTAPAHEERPPPSPSDSNQTVVASLTDDGDDPNRNDIIVQAGSRTAIFSTEMGSRAARAAPQPPFMPPIARSDKVQAVVDTAMFWRKKYPRVCWNIFPDQTWEIEDFFDNEDIHIYDPDHCREVIKFMSQDNVWSARKLALDWSCQYPKQFAKIFGQDSIASFDGTQPLSIVDNIFVHGETKLYPHLFLWHVANIMRLATQESSTLPNFATAGNGNSLAKTASGEHGHPAKAITSPADITVTEPPASSGPAPQIAQPADSTPKPFSTTTKQAPAPCVTAVAPTQIAAGKRPASQGPPQPGYGQQIGQAMGGGPAQAIVPQNMSGQPLVSSKIRTGRQYPPTMTSNVYSENVAHGPSGSFPSRQASGPMQPVHSPHFIPAAAAMGQGGMPPHPMHAYTQGYPPPLSPSTYPVQPYHQAGPVHPSMIPPQSAYMSVPQMPPGYVQQPSSVRGPRGTSMGDMTNSPYYANHGRPHNMDQRRSDRRNSSYGNGGHGLFDPYDGTNPAFNEHTAGRRPNRGGFMEQPGRPRMSSINSRPRTGSYENNWADTPTNNNRFGDQRPRPIYLTDNPAITGDAVRGCHQSWIGPENRDVNELFVSDFPDDTQHSELHEMFVHVVGITPVKVTVKQNYAGIRPHAFVLFNSVSDAKLALRAADANPTVRGAAVRITVPRRFYKKAEDPQTPYVPRHLDNKRAEERDNRTVARMSSHEEETVAAATKAPTIQTLYSPQDARSDLLKKASHPSADLDPVSRGSPKAHKVKLQHSIPAKESNIEPEGSQDEQATAVEDEQNATAEKSPIAKKDRAKATLVVAESTRVQEQISASLPLVDTKPVTAQLTAPTGEISQQSAPPAQDLSTVKHARVESQTKVAHEGTLQGAEEATVVVKMPGPTKDEEPSTKKDSNNRREKSEMLTQVDAEPETSKITSAEAGAGLESSTAPRKVVEESVAPPEVTSKTMTSNLGTEIAKVALEKSPIKERSCPEKTAQHEHSPATKEVPIPTAASTTVEITANTNNTDNTTTVNNTENMATDRPQSNTEAVKQQGPQQTPSLNPFAKPSKTQRRKEKEQKKRDQKKEQDGKTGKAKAGKFSSSTGPNAAASSTSTAASADAQPTKVTRHPTNQSFAQDTNFSKVQSSANARGTTSATTDKTSGIKEKDEVSGKQTGGTTTTTHDEIGTVTHKAKAAAQATAAPVKEGLSAPLTLESDALSPKPTGAAASEHAVTTAPISETSAEGSSRTDDSPATTKTKKTVPAVPHLQLASQSAATRGQVTQTTSKPAKAPLTELIVSEILDPIRQLRTASIASSDTLQPNDISQLSPSPTAQDFFTPMQTPALVSAPQEQIPKPKKKKNKKKKKKAATLQQVEGSDVRAPHNNEVYSLPSDDAQSQDENEYKADPFGSQISHIDAIRQFKNHPNNYYARVNREMAEQAEMAAQKKTEEERIVSTSGRGDHSSNSTGSSNQNVGLSSFALGALQELLSKTSNSG